MCREGVGGPLSIHPDFLGRFLNQRQLLEWAAYERLEPFNTERADARSSVEIYWLRQTMLENHNAKPEDYRLKFEDEEKTEAKQLMEEVAEIFAL